MCDDFRLFGYKAKIIGRHSRCFAPENWIDAVAPSWQENQIDAVMSSGRKIRAVVNSPWYLLNSDEVCI